MKLFYRELGKGEPLFILHGLYGSSDNWLSIAKVLEGYFRVILVDQRNHGQSPHSSSNSFSDLTSDLIELFDDLCIEKAFILGHSMGGKVAMQFAIDYPEKTRSLVVVDIAPWGLNFDSSIGQTVLEEHKQIISGLMSFPINSINSRIKADELLSITITSEKTRQFLLKNLKRERGNSFSWRFNLQAISQNLDKLMGSITPKNRNQKSLTKTIFIKGSLSNYILKEEEEELKKYFPNSEIVVIENSSHWVQADRPNEFLNVVIKFLTS